MRGFGGNWRARASGNMVFRATADGREEGRATSGQGGEHIDSPWSSSWYGGRVGALLVTSNVVDADGGELLDRRRSDVRQGLDGDRGLEPRRW